MQTFFCYLLQKLPGPTLCVREIRIYNRNAISFAHHDE